MTLLHFYRWNGKHDVMLIRQPRVGGQDVEGSFKLDKFGGYVRLRPKQSGRSKSVLTTYCISCKIEGRGE